MEYSKQNQSVIAPPPDHQIESPDLGESVTGNDRESLTWRSSEPLLKLLNVTFRWTALSGIDGITFAIRPGEFVLLEGRTGAGKTTLLELISMELVPMAGDIVLERFRISELKPRSLPAYRRCIGIVYQDLRLLEDRSALENVRLAASCEGNLPGSPKMRALKALARVGLSHKFHSLPGELSAGEQQRTAIARALVNEPLLLLADEPVSNLDGETAAEVVDLLRSVNLAGTAILVATHQHERFELCRPRVIRLEQGRMVED